MYIWFVNIWSGSKKLMKVVLKDKNRSGFSTTLMKGFDPLYMLILCVCVCVIFLYLFLYKLLEII